MEAASTQHPWFTWLLTFGALTALFAVCVDLVAFRVGQLHVRNWRVLLSYPPLWSAPAIAILWVIVIDASATLRPLAEPLRLDAFLWAQVFLAVCAGILARFVAEALPRVPNNRPNAPHDTAQAQPTPSLASWAAVERPLEFEDEDMLGHTPMAARIARRLTEASGSDVSIALLGPYGSGKTTILNWLKGRLSSSRSARVWVCAVSYWALEASAEGARYALTRAVETIEERLGRSVRTLPRTYSRLLASEPSGILARLFDEAIPPHDPLEELQRLSPILRATNARLVLFIEDADRQGKDFAPEHLARLLWGLKQVQGVSYVIAVDPSMAPRGLDFAKLCDHVEVVPRLEPATTRRWLRELRHECLSSADFIDTVTDRENADVLRLGTLDPEEDERIRRAVSGGARDELVDLIATPRALKAIVRRTQHVWQSLRGEADLDDLVAVNLLREAAPTAFEFLVTEMDALRNPRRKLSLIKRADEEPDPIVERWKQVCESTSNPAAVRTLIQRFGFESIIKNGLGTHQRPQGIAIQSPTDYFRRLLAEEVPAGETRDQEVLRDIDAWQRDREEHVVSRLITSEANDERYVNLWEHFADRLSVLSLRDLATAVLTGILKREGSRASRDHPAFNALWRRCNRQGPDAAWWLWLRDRIVEALPVSLKLANDLYSRWASPKYGPVRDSHEKLRAEVNAAAQRFYSSPAALLAALSDKAEFELKFLVSPPNGGARSVGGDPSQWSWLAEPVLAAAAINRETVLAVLIPLVGNFKEHAAVNVEEGVVDHTGSYELDRPRATALFGDRLPDALRLLASDDIGEPWSHVAARDEARRWLGELSSGASDGEAPSPDARAT